MSKRADWKQEFEEALSSGHWGEREAQAVLGAWSRSDLSLSEFAESHGLLSERLYRWRRRLSAEKAVVFHPVEIVESERCTSEPSGGDGTLELILGNEQRIVVGAGFDREHLRRLVETVGSWSC